MSIVMCSGILIIYIQENWCQKTGFRCSPLGFELSPATGGAAVGAPDGECGRAGGADGAKGRRSWRREAAAPASAPHRHAHTHAHTPHIIAHPAHTAHSSHTAHTTHTAHSRCRRLTECPRSGAAKRPPWLRAPQARESEPLLTVLLRQPQPEPAACGGRPGPELKRRGGGGRGGKWAWHGR